MAQGRDTISQRISIEGAQDVINALRNMGEAGERAIRSIQRAFESSGTTTEQVGTFTDKVRAHFVAVHEAATQAGERIHQVHEASRKFGEALNNTAEHIIPHWREVTTLATAGAVAGFVEVIKKSIEYGQEIKRVSEELGVTTTEYQRLRFTMLSVGLDQERFVSTFTRLARSVGEAVRQSREHIDQLLDEMFGRLQVGATQYVGTKGVLPGLHVVGVDAETEKQLKQAAETYQKRWAEILKESGAPAGSTVPPITAIMQKMRDSIQDTTAAGEKLRTEFFRFSGINLPMQSLHEAIERVKDSGSDMDVIFHRLGVQFQDLAGNVRPLDKVFDDVARSLGRYNEGEKQFIAQLIFNRGFKEILPLYAEGGREINKLREEFQQLGIVLEENEIEISSKLYASFQKLGFILTTVEANLVAIFGPNVQLILDGLTSWVTQNAARWSEWARRIASEVKPGIEEFFRYMRGEIDRKDVQIQWVRSLIDGLDEAKGAFNAIVGAIHVFTGIMQGAADVINTVFGTNFTGKQLAAIALVGQLTGAIGALVAGIELIGVTLRVLATTNPWVFLVTAFIIVAKELYDNWDAVKANLNRALAGWVALFKWLGSQVSAVWDAVTDRIMKVVNFIIDSVSKITGALGNLGSGAAKAAAAAPAPFSTGGPVGGSGTGDHVPALLEPNEFVVKKSAVAQVGLDFMHALNNGFLPRFAIGGVVSRLSSVTPSPLRLSNGGLTSPSAGAGRTFHLTIGDRTFRGLRASERTAHDMLNYALTSSMVSAGPRAGWDGNG